MFHTLQGVGNGTGLLKNFFLHVVSVRAQLSSATVGVHGFDRALCTLVVAVFNPILAQLNIDHVTFFEVHNLVCDARQGHGIAGQKVFMV